MSAYNLNPCPFCGSTDVIIVERHGFFNLSYVMCRGCQATTKSSISREDAVANWNRYNPPRKGKWMNGRGYEYEYAYCSECGRMQFAGWDTHKQAEENIESFACDYKYCPCCGAKMEGGVYVK